MAVLSVILAHAAVPFTQGGFMGVDVFFVISGYLISALLVNELANNGRVDLPRFYARRFRRLAPALLVMLALCLAAAYLLISPLDQRQHLTSGALAAFWVSNFHFAFEGLNYFEPEAGENLFLHTWSLGVEEQFYLVWPALLAVTFLLWRRLGSSRQIGGALLCMSLLLSAASLAWLGYSEAYQQNYFLPFARIWQFGAGAAALAIGSYLGSRDPVPGTGDPISRPVIGGFLSISGLVILLLGMALYDETFTYPGTWSVLPTVGTALLLMGGNSDNLITRFFATRPMVYVGGLSYGWYLWHWPALVFAQVLDPQNSPTARLGAVAVSFMLAVASLYLVENPIRHSRFLSDKTRSTVLATLATMTVVAGVAFSAAESNYNQILTSDRLNNLFMARNDLPTIYLEGCDDWFESAELRPCSAPASNHEKTAYLIGDSVAGQWHSAIAAVPGWHVTTLTKSACPMLDESYFYKRIDAVYTVCDQWKASVIADVRTNNPDVVVVGSAHNYPLSVDQWTAGSRRFLAQLAPHVGEIIVLEPTPSLPANPLGCIANKLWQSQSLPFELPTHCAMAFDGAALTSVQLALRAAATDVSKARTVQLNDLVCPEGLCRGMRDGTVVFRDATHVSDSFVRKVTPKIVERLLLP